MHTTGEDPQIIKAKLELIAHLQSRNKLLFLRRYIEKSDVEIQVVERVIAKELPDERLAAAVFYEIGMVENLPGVDDILPVSLRITKPEYIKALADEEYKKQLEKTISKALVFTSNKITPPQTSFLGLMTPTIKAVSPKLRLVHDAYIDVKNLFEKI